MSELLQDISIAVREELIALHAGHMGVGDHTAQELATNIRNARMRYDVDRRFHNAIERSTARMMQIVDGAIANATSTKPAPAAEKHGVHGGDGSTLPEPRAEGPAVPQLPRDAILHKLREIIAEQLCVNVDDVLLTSDLVDDLGADSLDVVGLLLAAEAEYGFEIFDADAEKIHTILQAAEYIEARLEAPTTADNRRHGRGEL